MGRSSSECKKLLDRRKKNPQNMKSYQKIAEQLNDTGHQVCHQELGECFLTGLRPGHNPRYPANILGTRK